MELLRSPRNKLIAAALLLLGLSATALSRGMDAPSVARLVLVAASLAGLALWVRRTRTVSGTPAPARLQVLSRAGLAQRCGVALVEADGRTFLVVHGDGYAEVCEAPSGVRRQARSAPRKARRPMVVRGGGR